MSYNNIFQGGQTPDDTMYMMSGLEVTSLCTKPGYNNPYISFYLTIANGQPIFLTH